MEKEEKNPVPKLDMDTDFNSKGLENGVFGKWTIILRNLGGVVAVFTTCFTSILYVYTTYISVAHGNGWPNTTSLLIITCGPIIVAFTFMNSGKILQILSKAGGVGDSLRKRTLQALSRADDDDPRPQPKSVRADNDNVPPANP